MARRRRKAPRERRQPPAGPGLVRWLVLAALAVCFVLLQRGLWFTTSGLPHGWHLASRVSKQRSRNSALDQANGRRWEEVKDLKHGKAAVEEHARMDLGLVKKGETFYQIVQAPKGATARPAATAPVPATGGR